MRISSINIVNFAGVKNKKINLDSGMNIIYGENEKGKSSIQAFIKIWLFGISSRGGLRKKYLPFTGENMEGEIYLSDDENEYVVKRILGKVKKEDKVEIINLKTGESFKDFEGKEPGEYFLNLSEKGFNNTLYIPQLGVEVKGGKEDEILEKVQEVFGGGKGDVSANKGIEKLEELKKSISNSRKNGALDKIYLKLDNLKSEKYDLLGIIEKNLDDEKKIVDNKKKNENLKEEIEKLSVYKKYLKKSILKKEYENIFRYLEKAEKIKDEEEFLDNELKLEGRRLSIEEVNGLQKDIDLLRVEEKNKTEIKNHIKNIEGTLEEEKNKVEGYEFFNSLDIGIKERIMKLNIEQERIEEKLKQKEKIMKSINKEEEEGEEQEKRLGKILELKPFIEEIEELEREYRLEKEFLKEKKNENKKEKKIGMILALIGGSGLLINAIIVKNMIGYIILILILVGGLFLYINKGKVRENPKKRETKENISFIENRFNELLGLSGLQEYRELFESVIKLKTTMEVEEKRNFIIEERLNIIEELKLEAEELKYNQNKRMLDSMIKMAGAENLEGLYIKIDEYIKLKNKEVDSLNIKNNLVVDLKRVEENIEKLDLLSKVERYGLKNKYNSGKIEEYLEEYSQCLFKIEKLREALRNVEEAYETMLRGREIEEIKEDFKTLGTDISSYNYDKEEDLDEEIKNKSNEVIELEKKVKDLENGIKLKLAGKRTLNEIEEELISLEKVSEDYIKKNKAIEIALEILKDSDKKLKSKFGPALNENIGNIFSELTNNKYSNVILKENYSMMVNNNERIFGNEFLSNGSRDQLYLSLRLGFIQMIFKEKEVPIILDEAFLQYDDIRRERAMKLLGRLENTQIIIFTCQKIEERIAKNSKIKGKVIWI